jgi:RNA polymerase sigma-70 factor (ECF subfamily)
VRAAYLVVRDRTLAEDVVQAAFVRAFERIGTFHSERPFAPWFLKLVVNDALKAVARRTREPTADGAIAAQQADQQPTPERAWELAETADAVWAALGRLTPDQRAAIVQRYYLGLTEAEIAATLSRPQSTVKARLHAARERLRLLLQPTLGD